MPELLSPVGNKEAFYEAIANGCDAIYLGLNKHNARAYADNFSLDNLKEYIDFAHLRNVKIYVTLNTIIYDNELDEIYRIIDELALFGVDAIIVQDLAVLFYATNKYESLQVHASTQMGIDDVYGAKLLKDIGVSRIVLARETALEKIKQIKEKANIEVETFIHGALCVSYSGNCFMSSTIGERSGNRGRCAGCCRKLYTLLDLDNKENVKTGYLLSMKDLNVSSYLDKMSFIDSFKIEGRMKEESYVASVTNTYRKLIDKEEVDINDLNKVFNRTYTKGFVFNEDKGNITNITRPNNYGYLVGKVSAVSGNRIQIKLYSPLNKGDIIRLENEDGFNDINITISKMFDLNNKVVEKGEKHVVIYTDKRVKINTKIYKVKDEQFLNNINSSSRSKEYRKLPIDVHVKICLNEPIFMQIKHKNMVICEKSDYIVQKSLTKSSTKEDVYNHINKLNDTPYFINDFSAFLDEETFVPVKVINELRRKLIERLNNERLKREIITQKNDKKITPKKHEIIKPKLSIEVSNKEQYDLAISLGYKDVYFSNIVRRNNAKYVATNKDVLVGGLGGINYYKNKNVNLIGDVSLNVTNHISAGYLSELGLDRITLSSELNKEQIDKLVASYIDEYDTYPNFELIVYGRNKIMHSLYCPLKRVGKCGECKKHHFGLRDEYETFPLMFNDDCSIHLLNSKALNLLDDIKDIKNINYFRLVFTLESLEEMEKILTLASNKINNEDDNKCFVGKIHTKGNFKKQLL